MYDLIKADIEEEIRVYLRANRDKLENVATLTPYVHGLIASHARLVADKLSAAVQSIDLDRLVKEIRNEQNKSQR